MVNVMVFSATGFPAWSVTAPVCSIRVYLVFAFSRAAWVIVRTLTPVLVVIVTRVPLLVFSSIQ